MVSMCFASKQLLTPQPQSLQELQAFVESGCADIGVLLSVWTTECGRIEFVFQALNKKEVTFAKW